MIDINVNGVLYGQIDPDALTWGDIIALEEVKGNKAAMDWLVSRAGMEASKLTDMPAKRIKELWEGVAAAVKAATELPN